MPFQPSAGPPDAAATPGPTDVTFLVASDTHVGFEGGEERANAALIRAANAMEGRAYPFAKDAPRVGRSQGLLLTGDLTETGGQNEWRRFESLYGLRGTETALHMPVYENAGNHDRGAGPWVEGEIARRHGSRHYTWTWGALHMFSLGEAPGEDALAWLKQALAATPREAPIMLFFHLPLDGPFARPNWFGDGDYRDQLYKLIADRNVAAIFHGHHHATAHYQWRGIEVFQPGAVKNGGRDLSVVHVTDRRVTVDVFDYASNRWASHFEHALSVPPKHAHAVLPPLDAPWIERLDSADGRAAGFVDPPTGARERRPVVVAMHGALSRPDWMCAETRASVGAYPFVVCPHAVADTSVLASWSTSEQMRREIDRAIDAVVARYGDYVSLEAPVYLGHSQGAMAAPYALALPGRVSFPYALFFEGLPSDASAARNALTHAGVERLALVSGQGGWQAGHARFAASFGASPVTARHVHGAIGHFFNAQAHATITREISWLTAESPAWRGAISHT